jgi:hypothetical protein
MFLLSLLLYVIPVGVCRTDGSSPRRLFVAVIAAMAYFAAFCGEGGLRVEGWKIHFPRRYKCTVVDVPYLVCLDSPDTIRCKYKLSALLDAWLQGCIISLILHS